MTTTISDYSTQGGTRRMSATFKEFAHEHGIRSLPRVELLHDLVYGNAYYSALGKQWGVGSQCVRMRAARIMDNFGVTRKPELQAAYIRYMEQLLNQKKVGGRTHVSSSY